MDIYELMEQRHSVRQYTDKAIEPEKRGVIDAMAAQINKEADLHIQIFYDESKCFDSFMAHYGKFTGVKNYIALVGEKNAETEKKLGYYGEALVLKAQELGLNTCWVALTHGKSKAIIQKGEKLVCLISLGYGTTTGVPHKNKALQEVCNATENAPEWFIRGVNAALLAPTAMNQQKFYFTLSSEEAVQATCGKGFYTKLDLGIVSYHFEMATEKKVRM